MPLWAAALLEDRGQSGSKTRKAGALIAGSHTVSVGNA